MTLIHRSEQSGDFVHYLLDKREFWGSGWQCKNCCSRTKLTSSIKSTQQSHAYQCGSSMWQSLDSKYRPASCWSRFAYEQPWKCPWWLIMINQIAMPVLDVRKSDYLPWPLFWPLLLLLLLLKLLVAASTEQWRVRSQHRSSQIKGICSRHLRKSRLTGNTHMHKFAWLKYDKQTEEPDLI